LLVDVCGVEDDFVKHCMMLNQIAEAEMAKIKKDKKMYNTFELNKQVFLMGFDSEIRKLTRMTKLLEQLESAEDEAQLATLLLPTAEGADRVHRAEAAHERSFYRALDRLMVL
jgi:glutamine amidotransferase PdxT